MIFVAVISLILLLNSVVGHALKAKQADMSEAAVAERIKPVGQLNTGEAINLNRGIDIIIVTAIPHLSPGVSSPCPYRAVFL